MSFLLEQLRHIVTESHSIIGFETTGGGAWPVWNRYLTVEGKRAYALGNICGTCRFFFERMEGANQGIDVGELVERLAAGVHHLDEELVSNLCRLMPAGEYFVALLSSAVTPVTLGAADDYFVTEQPATWG